MEDPHPLCIICGTRIPYRSTRHTWQRDYRAVRCGQNSTFTGTPFLTGIGSYVPPQIPDCVAPSNPSTRWTNAGTHGRIPQNDHFPPLIGHWARPQPGFLLHEACWELLERLVHPASVSVERLYDIVLSCPVDIGGWVDWGHAYGGLMERVPRVAYPWEDVYIVGFVKRYLGDVHSALTFAGADPFGVAEVEEGLVESRERSSDDDAVGSILPVFRREGDCFRRLPQEVLEAIRNLLPSSAIVNIRLASRSFASLPLDQFFWASRFDSYHDRGYCVEAVHPLYSDVTEQRRRDWKALYHKTAVTPESSNELKNRKRIVECTQDLVKILLENPLVDDTTLTRNLQAWPDDSDSESWRFIGGDFAPRYTPNHFPTGMRCRRIYEQNLIIPPSSRIMTLAVTFRRFSGVDYISGLRFIYHDGQEALFGYVIPHREGRVSIDDDGFHLTGFITAVSPRGFRALRAVSDKGVVSGWIGCPYGLPQSIRLCMRNRIEMLKGYFDGIKLVSLATPSSTLNNTSITNTPLFPESPSTNLRTSALWYPSLPPPSTVQNLNDHSFSARPAQSEYRPLVRIMFGNRGTADTPTGVDGRGALLPHLTKISVTASKSAIVGIDFHYDGAFIPSPAPTSHGNTQCLCYLQSSPSTATTDTSEKIPFTINGPGGERLTSIHSEGGMDDGVMTALKVVTNWNRRFTFQPSALPVFKLPVLGKARARARTTTQMGIAETETLTGIYFVHDAKYGMVSVGCVSEDLSLDSGPEDTRIEDEIRAQIKRR